MKRRKLDPALVARATRNRGLDESQERLSDPELRTPHRAADQASPEPERPVRPDEEAEQDIAQLKNPPQTEGPREENNDAV
jgi:hypothetical protein